jgi:predicted transcriptional regulator of viral defense system
VKKNEMLDNLLRANNGYIKTSDALSLGVSKTYFIEYAKSRELERVARGLYMSQDAWHDEMFIIQVRYPKAVFSHETALYLLDFAEREPAQYSITLEANSRSSILSKEGATVYKIKKELFEVGLSNAQSPFGNRLRTYNLERTICDLLRNRSNIEFQEFQAAIRGYARLRNKDLPLLMRYSKLFSVEKIARHYLEVLI